MESNPLGFLPDDELNSLPNPDDDNGNSRLLLLLFSKDKLLLFPPNFSNPPNRFASIMPKCRNTCYIILLVTFLSSCFDCYFY